MFTHLLREDVKRSREPCTCALKQKEPAFWRFHTLLYPLPTVIPGTDGAGLFVLKERNKHKLYKNVEALNFFIENGFIFCIFFHSNATDYTLLTFYWREGSTRKQFIEIGKHVGFCLILPSSFFQCWDFLRFFLYQSQEMAFGGLQQKTKDQGIAGEEKTFKD